MPNLAGQALDYIRGLGGAMSGFGERAGLGLGKYARSAISSPFARRTSLGAIGGGLAGGMYGGQSGSGFSFSGAAMGAGLGAAGARYGGMFAKSGMTSGIGMRGATRRTMALGRADFRMAAAQGRMAKSFIGNTISRGFSRIQGLGR